MGIPCYFSSIIRKYKKIMIKQSNFSSKIDNLYIDSNSIIYDAIRKCDITSTDFVKELYQEVIFQLEQHIEDINPQCQVIIAFDGVAPMAKIQQQRERRFKSDLERKIRKSLYEKEEQWDTCNITPGTKFMKDLMTKLEKYFSKQQHIKIYSSNLPGEGEHKIFEYIRANPKLHEHTNTVIYGLDADLIMLCISHSTLCKNIYLYRETPHFIRSVERSLVPNETYLLDIKELIYHIQKDVNNMLNDYIFICFMLGNDFLPHFPALNIRTSGMDTLLNTYKKVFKNGDNKLVTKEKNIIWKNLKIFVKELSAFEHKKIKNEYYIRDKWEDKPIPIKTADDKMKLFTNIPIKNRDKEEFIDPFNKNWEERYYRELLDIEPTNNNIKNLCNNYLEGLEWTYKYYTDSCYDWRWKYNYAYPPLLVDLTKHIPYFDVEYIKKQDYNPLDPRIQLSFVLPEKSFNKLLELPNETKEKIKSLLFYDSPRYSWSFCKYFWEAHVSFPHADISTLEKLVL